MDKLQCDVINILLIMDYNRYIMLIIRTFVADMWRFSVGKVWNGQILYSRDNREGDSTTSEVIQHDIDNDTGY